MAIEIKLCNKIVFEANVVAKVFKRSVADQIEHWIKIGQLAEENPNLTYEFIKNILIAQQEVDSNKLEKYSSSSF
jgi:hypothetical protein